LGVGAFAGFGVGAGFGFGVGAGVGLGLGAGVSLGNIETINIETLGYVLGFDDGRWHLTRGSTKSSLCCRRLGRSLGEKVGNDVLDVSLGNIETINIETLGYVLGFDDGRWHLDALGCTRSHTWE
jgi:hypothetical protein